MIEKKDISRFLERIPERLRETIHTFCTDMWEGYLTVLQQFITTHQLDAQIVVDRFHVALHYRDGFDTLRKQELKRLKSTLSSSVYENDCHGALWLLRHNHHNLDDEQHLQLQRLLAHSPQLHEAYTLRTELSVIFDLKLSRKQGKHRLLKWIAKVERTALTCFDKAIKTIKSHLDLIANYFTRRANSGFVEGFNNKLKVIKRRCYGLKSTQRLFQHLWLDTQGYAYFS